MRLKAIQAVGNLRLDRFAPTLVNQLGDDNPGIVREAARALEKVIGIQNTVLRVLETADKSGPEQIQVIATALRFIRDRAAVVEAVEEVMTSGQVEQAEAARLLLSEIGGLSAFQKLRSRTEATVKYAAVLEKAEEKVRNLFEKSIQEARQGFKVSILMDVIVYFVGIILIATSAGIVLARGGSLDGWVGIGLTTGTGVLGVVYGTLIAKPRQQVQSAVDHLMYLQVIFLAYLRQLHQVDQAYTRRILDDPSLTPDELRRFSEAIEKIMGDSLKHLIVLHKTSNGDTIGESLIVNAAQTLEDLR
jgi:hypothetical protein